MLCIVFVYHTPVCALGNCMQVASQKTFTHGGTFGSFKCLLPSYIQTINCCMQLAFAVELSSLFVNYYILLHDLLLKLFSEKGARRGVSRETPSLSCNDSHKIKGITAKLY